MALTIDQQREFFDAMYSREGFSYASKPPRLLRQLVAQLPRDARALDLGCGDGRVALYLAQQDISVLAVDISARGLQKLNDVAAERDLTSRITTRQADIRDLSFDNEAFDLLAAVTVLDHLPFEDIAPTLARLVRSLKTGGCLYASVHLKSDPGNQEDGPRASESAVAVEHYFESGELRRLAESHLVVDDYDEHRVKDQSHGDPHYHAFAELVARKLTAQLPLI